MILLSEREFEVMELLCEGLTNAGVSKRSGLTLYQIEMSLVGIYRKLDVDNRTMAVLRYIGYI